MTLEYGSMSQSTTAYVAGEVRAHLGRQGHDGTWLARQLDVSDMWVSRRLRGVTEFTADDLVRVAAVLDIDPALLLPQHTPARVA